MSASFTNIVSEAVQTFQQLAMQQPVFDGIAAAVVGALRGGGKLLTCGNGGSAADALHLAEELVGRYKHDRRSLPAICLNADPTLLTCIGNDYGFDQIFSRQVDGLADRKDLLVCFTTSGNSPNVLNALTTARTKGVRSVALLGKDGGHAKGQADWELIVPSRDAGRVQEAHTLILHALLEAVEASL